MTRAAPVLIAALCVAGSARGAEITRVASSADPGHPFGFFIDVGYDFLLERGKLTREWYQSGTSLDVDELKYERARHSLTLDAYIGLYQDLQFHFGMPIIFADNRSWAFAQGTDATNTTIYRNCVQPDGTNYPGCTPGGALPTDPRSRLFEVDGAKSFRSGIGNLTFGLAYAFFSQKRDDTKPTWTASFDYTAPTAAAVNPSEPTTASTRGPIGDRIHRYTFATALSKRISFVEPYFQLWYTLPFRGPGFYSNCDDPSAARQGRPQNCGVAGWDRKATGISPAHQGGVRFGTEVVVFENEAMKQRFAFDVRGLIHYISEGRDYNEMSDLLGKLLYSQDYVRLGGQVGFVGHAAEYVRLAAWVSLEYQSEHFVTREEPGQDFNNNKTIDFTGAPDEINPNYDWRVDHPGRRFRITESSVFKVFVQATFAF
jgi:hypothetical protein